MLDRGKQIKILDLPRDLIMLAGLIPEEDIEIRYTGMRPGEKLSEKLYTEAEAPFGTDFEKILELNPNSWDVEDLFRSRVGELIRTAHAGDRDRVRELLDSLVG